MIIRGIGNVLHVLYQRLSAPLFMLLKIGDILQPSALYLLF